MRHTPIAGLMLAGALVFGGYGGGWRGGYGGPFVAIPSGASVYDVRPAGPTWIGAPLSGQTVCEYVTREALPARSRPFYYDGEAAHGPKYAGTWCIRLQ